MHADSRFSQLGGAGFDECGECSAAVLVNAHVNIHSCAFSSLVPAAASGYIRAMGDGSALVTETRFAAAPAALHVEHNATFYSDDRSLLLTAADGTTAPPQPISSGTGPPQAGEHFLSGTDPWLMAMRSVRCAARLCKCNTLVGRWLYVEYDGVYTAVRPSALASMPATGAVQPCGRWQAAGAGEVRQRYRVLFCGRAGVVPARCARPVLP